MFANVKIQNRRGLYLLGELHFEFPRTNYIGVATKVSQSDARCFTAFTQMVISSSRLY